MESRLVLIAFVMTVGALIWLTVLGSQDEESAAPTPSEVAAAESPGTESPAPSEVGNAADSPAEPAEGSAQAEGSAAGRAAANAATGDVVATIRALEPAEELEPEIVAEGERGFTATFSSKGASVASVRLNNPQYDRREDEEASQAPPPEKLAPGPLDIITTWDFPFYPFRLEFKKLEAGGVALSSAYGDEVDYAKVIDEPDRVVFVWPDPSAVTSPVYIEREYALDGEYRMKARVTVHNVSSEPASVQYDLIMTAWQDPQADGGSFFMPRADVLRGACYSGDSLTYETLQDLVEEPVAPAGSVSWAGTSSQYFLVAAVPTESEQTQCSMSAGSNGVIDTRIHQTQATVLPAARKPCTPSWIPASRRTGPTCESLYKKLGAEPGATARELSDAKGEAIAAVYDNAAERKAVEEAYESLVSGASRTWTYTIFAGPKDIDALDATGSNLDKALDFGWFGFIAQPMLYFMRWCQSFVGSWALAIVLLTILVKLLLFPLTQKSYKSMKVMRDVAPEMKALQAKYKDDRAKLNEEMMALYRSRGANPLGGCLPMVMQMPVWIALYQTIYAAVDLYQAPLFGWIDNMTAPDPLYILPLFLGVTMFIQQKLTPTAGDAQQAKMMAIVMPIMFTGMMLFLPAGLVLYIFVNTLLGIAQQWYVYQRT